MTDALRPGMLLEVGADERAVLRPLVERVGRAVRAEKALAAARDERQDRGFLVGREGELAARQREKQHVVVRQGRGGDAETSSVAVTVNRASDRRDP